VSFACTNLTGAYISPAYKEGVALMLFLEALTIGTFGIPMVSGSSAAGR
jgi:hypothetical protein